MQESSTSKRWPLQKILAIAISSLVGWGSTWLATSVFQQYAWGLFLWLPAVMGVLSTLVYAYRNPVSKSELRNTAFLGLLVFFGGLLLFAWEGIICMLMAAPFGFLLIYIGHLIGYALSRRQFRNGTPTAIILFIISVPVFLSFEKGAISDEWRSVTTSIEIDASPEKVWGSVVSFPKLKDPREFIFRTGIAYPIDATISGHGVGAIRHCNFSTGCFVEPITVWDEPNLLRFGVKDQPEPMKEISLYEIHPNHLHGYWVSRQGQFKLTRLPNGHTLLEGTTWYTNKIKPDLYWTLWSDYIVHKIHWRVLEHIKTQAESAIIR
jgi:hypothetical protein